MAEPTLSITYSELVDDIAYFLHGKANTDCTVAQKAVIDNALQTGYRMFLYPPAIEGIETGYEWTFLRPVTTIDTTADDVDQDMPDDFGRLIGDGFTYETNSQVPMVLADVGEGRIRKLRQARSETGRPRVAGFRRKAGGGTAGQKWEVMWYPTPDDAYTLIYRFEALIDKLTSEKSYPLGSMKHGETLRAACLAAADDLVNDGAENKLLLFQRRLTASIQRDRNEQRKFFGNVGTHGEYDDESILRRGIDGGYTISVSGDQTYPSS